MNLEILTPDNCLFTGKVKSLKVPGKKGAFMILHNHAPIVSRLEKGDIVINTHEYKEEKISIYSGVIEVKRNKITVLVDIR